MSPRLTILALLLWLTTCPATPSQRNETQFFAFETLVSVTLWGVDEAKAKQAWERLKQDFHDQHQAWDAWGGGALGQANRLLAHGREVALTSLPIPLVQRSLSFCKASGGLFDPGIGRLVELWKFHREDVPVLKPPPAQAIAALMAQRPSMVDLHLNGTRLSSDDPQVWLDFGAVAKGYAVDKAIERLHAMGIENALVSAGGDLRVIGRAGERAWRIGIRHPRNSSVLASLVIEGNGSVSTSGDYERFFMFDDQRYHHILDPRTGYPARGAVSVTVLHQDAITADAAATALFVAGPAQWEQTARRMGIERAMLVDERGKIFISPAMRQVLSPSLDPGFQIDLRPR